MDELITQVAYHLRRAERILFITGAGLSADSGLPTYRGIGGLYNEKLSADSGAPTVEINPGETEISHLVDYQIRAGAADVLTRLWTVAF